MKTNTEIAAQLESNKNEVAELIKQATTLGSLHPVTLGYDHDTQAFKAWEANSKNIFETTDPSVQRLRSFEFDTPSYSAAEITEFIMNQFEDEVFNDFTDLHKDLIQKGAEDLAEYLTDEQASDHHGIRQAMADEYFEEDFLEDILNELDELIHDMLGNEQAEDEDPIFEDERDEDTDQYDIIRCAN